MATSALLGDLGGLSATMRQCMRGMMTGRIIGVMWIREHRLYWWVYSFRACSGTRSGPRPSGLARLSTRDWQYEDMMMRWVITCGRGAHNQWLRRCQSAPVKLQALGLSAWALYRLPAPVNHCVVAAPAHEPPSAAHEGVAWCRLGSLSAAFA